MIRVTRGSSFAGICSRLQYSLTAKQHCNAKAVQSNQMMTVATHSCCHTTSPSGNSHSCTRTFSSDSAVAAATASSKAASTATNLHSDPFLHLPQQFNPHNRDGNGNTSGAMDAYTPSIPSFLHLSTRPSSTPTPIPVPLAFRRTVIGDPFHATPLRLKPNQQFPIVPSSLPPSSAPVACFNFVFLHCLLGDSKQFHMFEAALHNAINQANTNAAASGNNSTQNNQVLLHVWNIDLRNHGSSPHTAVHSYHDLIVDLYAFLHQHNIENPIICAHSQGAKTALAYALAMSQAPAQAAESRFQAKSLLILDAAPAAYTHTHSGIFDGMESVDFNDHTIKQRRDVEERLKPKLSSPTDRAFVLSNLLEDYSVPHQPQFSWRVNLPVLSRDEFNIHDWVHPPPTCSTDDSRDCRPNYTGPTLFIGGGKSTRLTTPEYTQHIQAYFPNHEMQMVPSAGHFVHQSHAKECAAWINQFLKKHVL